MYSDRFCVSGSYSRELGLFPLVEILSLPLSYGLSQNSSPTLRAESQSLTLSAEGNVEGTAQRN